MGRETLLFILKVVFGACLVPFIIMVFIYYKIGRYPPVSSHDLPKPILHFGRLMIGFGIVIILLIGLTSPPIRDKDGFGILAFQLTAPEAHGLPLLTGPRQNANYIRRVERFEGYVISDKEQSGFIKVMMARDDAIGWLDRDIAKPPSLVTAFRGMARWFSTAGRNLASALFHWKVAVEIAGGLLLSGIVLAIFGHKKGAFYNSKIDYAIMLLALFGAMSTKIALRALVPFSPTVGRMEAGAARWCVWFHLVLPSMIAASVANLLFGRCEKSAAAVELVLFLLCLFLFYVHAGAMAAWW